MALFGFGKKKEAKKNAPICACSTWEATEPGNNFRTEAKDNFCCIQVLGAGCASCHEQYENTKAAVQSMNLPADVEYITDLQTIMEYGVMCMPALVVNGAVVSTGKVLKPADVEKLLHSAGF